MFHWKKLWTSRGESFPKCILFTLRSCSTCFQNLSIVVWDAEKIKETHQVSILFNWIYFYFFSGEDPRVSYECWSSKQSIFLSTTRIECLGWTEVEMFSTAFPMETSVSLWWGLVLILLHCYCWHRKSAWLGLLNFQYLWIVFVYFCLMWSIKFIYEVWIKFGFMFSVLDSIF